jgi:hypothetical protein
MQRDDLHSADDDAKPAADSGHDTRSRLEDVVRDLRAVVAGLDDPGFDPRPLLQRVSRLFRRNAASLTEHPDLAVDIFRGLHDALVKDASDEARRRQPGGLCRLRLAQTELTVIIGAIYSEGLWAFDYGDEKDDFSLADAILHWQTLARVPVDLLTLFEEALNSSSPSNSDSAPASSKPHRP